MLSRYEKLIQDLNQLSAGLSQIAGDYAASAGTIGVVAETAIPYSDWLNSPDPQRFIMDSVRNQAEARLDAECYERGFNFTAGKMSEELILDHVNNVVKARFTWKL